MFREVKRRYEINRQYFIDKEAVHIFDLNGYYTAIVAEYDRQLAAPDYDSWAIFSASKNRALREFNGTVESGNEVSTKVAVSFALWSEYNEQLRTGAKSAGWDKRVAEYKLILTGAISIKEVAS